MSVQNWKLRFSVVLSHNIKSNIIAFLLHGYIILRLYNMQSPIHIFGITKYTGYLLCV